MPDIPSTASSPQDFKKKTGGPQIIELPSGLFMKCKQVSITTFIRDGNIPNALLAIINETLSKGDDFDVNEMLADGDMDIEKIREMYTMIDDIVIRVAVDPSIERNPENESDRRDSQVYLDEITDEDKMYLFQWSTGAVKDLETFRRESGASVAALEKVSIDQLPPESTDGAEVG